MQKLLPLAFVMLLSLYLLGARTFLQTWQMVQDSAMSVLGLDNRTDLQMIFVAVDKELDVPLRLSATSPTADSKLNIGSNQVEKGDGSTQSTSPSDDQINIFVPSTIDYLSGSVTGGTIEVESESFSLPACTEGEFRRHFIVYQSAGNNLNSIFSDESSTVAGLTNPGSLASSLEGTPVGYLDLECTDSSGQYKTAGSTSDVIENKVGSESRVFRFGSGAGSGAGGDDSFKIQSITSPEITIKGGFQLWNRKILGTYDGAGSLSTDFGVDVTYSLNTVLGSSPTDDVTYYLYIDTSVCCAAESVHAITTTDSGESFYPVEEADLVLKLTSPENTGDKYLPLGFVHTADSGNSWSGTGAYFGTQPTKRNTDIGVTNVSPVVYEKENFTIGTVGAVDNDIGPLVDGDITFANSAYFQLDGGASNTASLGGNLTPNGTTSFNDSGFFGRDSIARVADGYFSSSDAFFKSTTLTLGFWLKQDDWSQPSTSTIFNAGQTNDNFGVYSFTDNNNISFKIGTGGTATSVGAANSFSNGSWHHVAFSYDDGPKTMKIYIDGQLAGTDVSVGAVSYGASGMNLGSDSTSRDYFGAISDFFYTTDVLTDAQVNAIYSKRFKGRQYAAGHVLTADSFSQPNNVSFWNFSGDTVDQGLGKVLSVNSGSLTFTGSDIFGKPNGVLDFDSGEYLTSTDDAYFEADQFTMGGWYKTNWGVAATQVPFEAGRVTDSYGYRTNFESNIIAMRIGDSTTSDNHFITNDFVGGSWHHIVFQYRKDTQISKIFIDGVLASSKSSLSIVYGDEGSTFTIGAEWFGTRNFNGSMSNIFWTDQILNDAEIRKLYSSKLDHNANLPLNKQNWIAHYDDAKNQLDNGWILEKGMNSMYVDFGGAASDAYLELQLQDTKQNVSVSAQRVWSTGIVSATPSFPLSHNLGQVPTAIVVQHEGHAEESKWTNLDPQDWCTVDALEVLCDFGAITVDSDNRLRVVLSTGTNPLVTDEMPVEVYSKDRVLLPDLIDVPHTTITGRAKIRDLSKDMLPRMGINRIMTQSLVKKVGESGPNGEPVYGVVNDKWDQLRIATNRSTRVYNDAYGQYIGASFSVVEVTCYCTGLNMLALPNGNSTWNIKVDGVVHSTVVDGINSTLSDRKYSANTLHNLVTGLTLGIHTIEIENSSELNLTGFEILNETASLQIPAGQSKVGNNVFTRALPSTLPYNSGFESGTVGTKGGHVVVYQKTDGEVKHAINPVGTASTTLANVDHSNEEVIRSHFWREFGAGRSDDFSTLTNITGDKAFTLDDGTTTLVGDDVDGGTNLRLGTGGSSITFTFVGTGLSIEAYLDSAGTQDTHTILVDGVSVGNLTGLSASSALYKIASNLPYGTHTVRIPLTAVTGSVRLNVPNFIVYGPKKPTLPDGAMELSSYYLMADFVANAVQGIQTVSTGTIRKDASRELVYTGTWSFGQNVVSFIGGSGASSTASGATASLTFFGTGFDLRFGGSGAADFDVSVDGNADLSGYTTSEYGPVTLLTPATGSYQISGGGGDSIGLTVSGLSLGVHTVTFTTTDTVNTGVMAFDVITPIHSPKNNGPHVIQNTLMVGSQGMNDLREWGDQIEEASPTITAKHVSGDLSDAITTSYIPMKDMGVTIETTGNPIEITWNGSISRNSGSPTILYVAFSVDGVEMVNRIRSYQPASNEDESVSLTEIVRLPAGMHNIQVVHRLNSAVTTFRVTDRFLSVREL